jgi:hypothetical protein
MMAKNDEDKMKQRGLDVSNKEKPVSFLQRLKMGNIDDPKSEAYKQFGAGRGRKDRDDADFAAEEARDKTARAQAGKAAEKTDAPAKQATAKQATAKQATAKKAPVVTKEELAKSGLSLRDYMNKQQGKTRRDGTAPAGKAKTAAEYSDSTDAMRNRSRMAANSANKKSSTTDALRAKSRKEAAFEGAKRMAKTPEGQAQRKAQEKGQALERVTPEEYIVGGGAGLGLKSLNQMAKNLAKPKIKEYNPITLPAPKAAPKVDTKALPAPTKRLEYDKKGALEARREAKDVRLKSEVAEENAARYGLNPRAPGYESAAKAVRKEMGEKDFSFKKGGSVRGAGIAQRGVRKCKMV